MTHEEITSKFRKLNSQLKIQDEIIEVVEKLDSLDSLDELGNLLRGANN
jgi:hypothetical protein